MRLYLVATTAALLSLAPLPAPPASAETVALTTTDGVTIHVDRVLPEGEPRATVLLFHQENGNAGEYAEIAPRLAAMGFEAVAADQRLGGALFMRENRTMAGLPAPAMDFDGAMADLRAVSAWAWEEPPEAPVVLWGSGYSADLVVAMAADEQEGILGVLAFSPPLFSRRFDPLAAAATLRAPLFVTYGTEGGEWERLRAKRLAAAAPQGTLFAPEVGARGSVTLVEDHNPRGSEAAWAAVSAFLDRVAPAAPANGIVTR